MKKKILALSIIALINLNVTTVKAEELCKIYYLENTYEEQLNFKEYIILGELMNEDKIKLILETFLYNSEKNIRYIPEGTKILGAQIINKDLFINFNNKIEEYGGTYYETNLIRQILYLCFQYEDIQTVSFLIEGKFKCLPEGNLVFKYNRQDLEIMDHNQNVYLKDNM